VSFSNRLYFTLALPAVAIVAPVIGYFLIWIVRDAILRRASHSLKHYVVMASRSTLIIMVLIHPMTTNTALQVFNCKTIQGERLLFVDLSVNCASAEYQLARTVSGAFLGIFTLGFPLAGALIMWRFKAKLDTSATSIALWNYMYWGYRNGAFFWEFVVMIRKVTIVAILVFLANSPAQQIQAVIFVTYASLVLQIIADPYVHKVTSRMEIVSLSTCFVIVNAGYVFLGGGTLPRADRVLVTVSMFVIIAVAIVLLLAGIVVGAKMDKAALDAVEGPEVDRQRQFDIIYGIAGDEVSVELDEIVDAEARKRQELLDKIYTRFDNRKLDPVRVPPGSAFGWGTVAAESDTPPEADSQEHGGPVVVDEGGGLWNFWFSTSRHAGAQAEGGDGEGGDDGEEGSNAGGNDDGDDNVGDGEGNGVVVGVESGGNPSDCDGGENADPDSAWDLLAILGLRASGATDVQGDSDVVDPDADMLDDKDASQTTPATSQVATFIDEQVKNE
jgi:hypothetical protein